MENTDKDAVMVLVTGGDGQLGKSLQMACVPSRDVYMFTDRNELDITDSVAVESMVAQWHPDVIVNCAAYTDVERAECDPGGAMLLNATAAGNLSRAAAAHGAVMVHVSTDYVFGDGMLNTPATETQPTAPTGVYGYTKLCGEKEIAQSGAPALILRTSWLYSEYGRNFVKTMLDLTSSKPQVKVVYDQVGTPTYAGDLAAAIVSIISRRMLRGFEGIYNYSNEGVCSWFDFARAIARMAGNEGCEIVPCRSGEFGSKVKRPPYSVLDKSLIKHKFELDIPYWTDSLQKCLANMDLTRR